MDSDQDKDSPSLIKALLRAFLEMQDKLHLMTVAAAVGGLLPLLDTLWSKVSDWGITAGVIGVAVAVLANALVDRSSSTLLIRTVILRRRLARLNISYRTKPKEVAMSLTYLGHLRRSSASTKIALALAASCSAIAHLRYPDHSLLPIALICTAVLALILLKEMIVEFRVRHGYFGTTRAEAKDLIAFMIKNAKDIDFHDDSGSLRKALLPQDKEVSGHGIALSPGQVQP